MIVTKKIDGDGDVEDFYESWKAEGNDSEPEVFYLSHDAFAPKDSHEVILHFVHADRPVTAPELRGLAEELMGLANHVEGWTKQ